MLRFRDLILLYFSWNFVGDVSVPRGNSSLFVHQGIKLSNYMKNSQMPIKRLTDLQPLK